MRIAKPSGPTSRLAIIITRPNIALPSSVLPPSPRPQTLPQSPPPPPRPYQCASSPPYVLPMWPSPLPPPAEVLSHGAHRPRGRGRGGGSSDRANRDEVARATCSPFRRLVDAEDSPGEAFILPTFVIFCIENCHRLLFHFFFFHRHRRRRIPRTRAVCRSRSPRPRHKMTQMTRNSVTRLSLRGPHCVYDPSLQNTIAYLANRCP